MADMREMFSSSNAMTAEEERRFMERQAKEGNEMLQLERNLKKLNKGKGKKKKEEPKDAEGLLSKKLDNLLKEARIDSDLMSSLEKALRILKVQQKIFRLL